MKLTEGADGSSGASPKLVSAVLVQKNWNDTGKDLTLDMGTFEIDSVDMSGPPDKVTVKAHPFHTLQSYEWRKRIRHGKIFH